MGQLSPTRWAAHLPGRLAQQGHEAVARLNRIDTAERRVAQLAHDLVAWDAQILERPLPVEMLHSGKADVFGADSGLIEAIAGSYPGAHVVPARVQHGARRGSHRRSIGRGAGSNSQVFAAASASRRIDRFESWLCKNSSTGRVRRISRRDRVSRESNLAAYIWLDAARENFFSHVADV